MIVPASGHQVRCIPWCRWAHLTKRSVFMWIKILCIEYISWGILTIESTFDVANMVKTATVKDVPINNDALLNITGLLNSSLGKWHLLPYLVVPLISARVPLISTRVSAHCQTILLKVWLKLTHNGTHGLLSYPCIKWPEIDIWIPIFIGFWFGS